MATRADLVVHLSAIASKFNAGIASAQKLINRFAESVKKTFLGLPKHMLAATVGTVSFGAAVYGVQSRIAKLAKVSDEAVKTGLSGNFLQRLGYAADQSGIDIDTLTTSLKMMTVQIGKGAKGTEGLAGLTPEAAFMQVAARISAIPTAAGRAAEAMRMFGRTGKDMTGLFAGGLNDVNKLLKEAADLGIGLSDEQLQMAAKADDAIQKMKASFGAMFDKLAVTAAPLLIDIADKITGWLTPLNQFMDKFNELPDKFEWAGQVLEASFDLAMEHIRAKWSEMLNEFRQGLMDTVAAPLWAEKKQVGRNPFAPGGALAGGPQQAQDNAARLAGLMGQLDVGGRGNRTGHFADASQGNDLWKANGPTGEFGVQGVPPADVIAKAAAKSDEANQQAFNRLFPDLGEKLSGPLAEMKQSALNKLTEMKLNANFLGGVVQKAFGVGGSKIAEQQQEKRFEPRLAGAMQRGSAEAFSTIVQAMIRGKQDPNVKATEKQTKEIVAALAKNKPPAFAILEAFGV